MFEQQEFINPLNLIVLMGFMGMLPFFLTMLTAYVKVVVVTYLIRNALGVQQVPPTMVLTGLALILSVFVMAPVGVETYELVKQLDLRADASLSELIEAAAAVSDPLHGFLKANTDPYVLNGFISAAYNIWPQDMHNVFADDSFVFVIPSYVITELTEAFETGFLLYLPFIAVDLIISNILLAMGMMMVSPMTVSLPFKLMLFVTLEGWLKITQGLMYSYSYV